MRALQLPNYLDDDDDNNNNDVDDNNFFENVPNFFLIFLFEKKN